MTDLPDPAPGPAAGPAPAPARTPEGPPGAVAQAHALLDAIRSATGLVSDHDGTDRVVQAAEVAAAWRTVMARARRCDAEAMEALGALVGDATTLALTGLTRADALDAIGDAGLRRRLVLDLHLTTPALAALHMATADGNLRATLDEVLVAEAERTGDRVLAGRLEHAADPDVAWRARLVTGHALVAHLEDLRRLPADTPHLGPVIGAVARARRELEDWLERTAPTAPPDGTDAVVELQRRIRTSVRAVQDQLAHRVLDDLRALFEAPVTSMARWEGRAARAADNAVAWLRDAAGEGAATAPLALDIRHALELAERRGPEWAHQSARAARAARARRGAASEAWETLGVMSVLPALVALLLVGRYAVPAAAVSLAGLALCVLAAGRRRALGREGAWIGYYDEPDA